jgi:hypothetical protein
LPALHFDVDQEFRRLPARLEPAKGPKPGGDIQLEPDTPPPAGSGLRPCPACGRLIPPDSRRCIHCGEHRSGAAPAPDADAPPKPCAFCNYDLRGIAGSNCPECGKLQPKHSRRARDELLARDATRHDIKRCSIYIAAAVLLITSLAFFGNGGDLLSVAWTLLYFGAASATAILVYLGCGLIWLGLDGGLGLLSLRVVAAVSVAYLMSFLSGLLMYLFACLGYFSMVLPLVAYAAMLWEMCDLDLQDGILVALLTAGAVAAVLFAITAAF